MKTRNHPLGCCASCWGQLVFASPRKPLRPSWRSVGVNRDSRLPRSRCRTLHCCSVALSQQGNVSGAHMINIGLWPEYISDYRIHLHCKLLVPFPQIFQNLTAGLHLLLTNLLDQKAVVLESQPHHNAAFLLSCSVALCKLHCEISNHTKRVERSALQSSQMCLHEPPQLPFRDGQGAQSQVIHFRCQLRETFRNWLRNTPGSKKLLSVLLQVLAVFQADCRCKRRSQGLHVPAQHIMSTLGSAPKRRHRQCH
mmetsp:Transcript_70802/g.188891  ORF Transcript_70802/g.188891 Transcript_70802/m.188891 type:complete len:253 (+) Transcript_70802:876-1634(+)